MAGSLAEIKERMDFSPSQKEVTDQKYSGSTTLGMLPDSGGQFDRDTTQLRINRVSIQIKKDSIAPSRLIKDDLIVKREAQYKLKLPGFPSRTTGACHF